MEEFLEENVYLIDLSKIDTIPEIIFELSSVLDKEEARNRRICLKLGNITLNQAQLLSIKSLINGIGSSLSSIDTKSTETEKTAISLGIIVSNVLPENSSDITPSVTYKMADELNSEEKNTVEETENIPPKQEQDTKEEVQPEIKSDNNATVEKSDKNGYQDELDVIFNSNSAETNVFNTEEASSTDDEKEIFTDITVPEQEYTKEDIEIEEFPTKYIKQTIRSGQVINYDGNVVIVGDCHPGSEVTALGDITVWGVLSGIAHAGSGGNPKAKVRALRMNAIQLRIASCYSRRPDFLNTIVVEKTNSFTPEEAKIVNGEIIVFKMND